MIAPAFCVLSQFLRALLPARNDGGFLDFHHLLYLDANFDEPLGHLIRRAKPDEPGSSGKRCPSRRYGLPGHHLRRLRLYPGYLPGNQER